MPSGASPTGLDIRSESVHVIASGDVAGLQSAITESNQNPTTLYKIYLEAGDYPLAQTLVIFGTVEIYGAHADTTILRQIGTPGSQSGSMNTMIKVPGISLKLDHLTLRDGATNDPTANNDKGGAIHVESSSATLTVTNARFMNNTASDPDNGYGGAIYSNGVMTLEKIYFVGNSASRGGALASNASPFIAGHAAVIKTVDFKNNHVTTSNGGAVHVASGTIKVRNSNFRNNSAVTSDAIRHHIASYTLSTGSAAANAKKNYWNNPTVASDANLNGVNTLKQLASKVEFAFGLCHRPHPFRDHRQHVCLNSSVYCLQRPIALLLTLSLSDIFSVR
ncbi:MAG: polymorphic outer membrane protein [Chloroflexi bacterium OLB13]|nr:MAG: polymorphic outer membrane protein [Chloroflexi bacterium OLB13]